ncbi:hypothetical protein, partial [Roseisolibacter sp. H3M3-2]|uniref:hypothetical protein n=1 Tax=Roseisolibacter sp. H3M3-2 TaxID=3031323 RepID=UPI0023D9A6E4
LAGVLPASPPARSSRWRWAPVAAMAASAVAILAGAALASGRPWSALYTLPAVLALMQLAPFLLRRFGLI